MAGEGFSFDLDKPNAPTVKCGTVNHTIWRGEVQAMADLESHCMQALVMSCPMELWSEHAVKCEAGTDFIEQKYV